MRATTTDNGKNYVAAFHVFNAEAAQQLLAVHCVQVILKLLKHEACKGSNLYRVLALQNETLNCPVELEPDTLAENNETQFLGDLEVVDPEILSDGCSR